MRFAMPGVTVITGLFASAGRALSASNVPSDVPVSALLNSAQALLANGETSEALVYYDAAIAKDPSNYLTFFKRATTYLSLGRPAQASDDFNKVLALKPGFEGAHLQLAKIKSKAAEWEAARADFKAAKKGVDSSEIAELAEAEDAAKLAADAAKGARWDECINYAGVSILVASRSPSLRQIRARCRFERGDIEEGMSDLHHVLQMRPGDTDPHVLISATTFYGFGDLRNGLAQIRKCLHSDTDSKVCNKLFKQQKLIQKTYSKAQDQLEKGQPTTAGRTLTGNTQEPGLVPKIREEVEALRQEGRIPARSRAILYDQALEMLCQAYLESNHRDAQKYCEESLHLDRQSFWGLVHRGKVLLKKEEYEAAIETLNQAVEARPDKQDKVKPILNKAQIALKHSKTKDYYKILGVARDADERQIKSTYRKASKQHHPDKAAMQGIEKEAAEKKMADINEAYEVLSNSELRARFDSGDDPNSQERSNSFQGPPFSGGAPFMFQQQGGQANFKFHFGGGGGGGPFGF